MREILLIAYRALITPIGGSKKEGKIDMSKEYQKLVECWQGIPILTEDAVSRGGGGLVAKMNIMPGAGPELQTGGAIFKGRFYGVGLELGLVSADAGIVRGKDHKDLNTFTLFTDKLLELWAETYDPSIAADTLAYFAAVFEQNRISEIHNLMRDNLMRASAREKREIMVGGILERVGPEQYPQFKMEYVVISGPDGGRKHQLLNRTYMEEL